MDPTYPGIVTIEHPNGSLTYIFRYRNTPAHRAKIIQDLYRLEKDPRHPFSSYDLFALNRKVEESAALVADHFPGCRR